ncbi:MAG: hypothetical protein RL172_1751 [Bacteroidota bacterium]|jgi:hypothetical protein
MAIIYKFDDTYFLLFNKISVMKKFYLGAFFYFLSLSVAQAQQPFTKGNLVVYKIGKGTSTNDTLTNAGTPVNIDEYTITGNFVRSVPMPVATAGNNKRLIGSGTANSEGQLSLSSDKKFLLLAGYDTIPDPARANIINAPSAIVNRSIAVIGADGSVDVTTALADAYSANNIRGVASTNGTDIWLAGTGTTGTNGVRYTTKGAASSSFVSSTVAPTVTNIRDVNIFNNQLYITTGSGAFKAISTVGTGTPADTGQIVTVLNGMPNTTANGPDPYAFDIKPGTGDVAYVADARSKSNGGGVQKWVLSAGTWSLAYTLDSNLTTGLRNLVVDWSGNTPVIYATTGESYMKNMPGNKIVSVADADSVSAFTVLATADVNYMFRGIEFAPEVSVTATTYTFTGNGNWNEASNWSNNTIPPSPLPANSAIVIDHAAGGQCVLNVPQTLSQGSTITVNAGKNMVVQGAITIQ